MAMLYILSTPRVYNRLTTELDAAVEKGEASTPILDAEAKKLPYLQAVIREGMRIFASQTPLLNKTVPQGGDTVAGFPVPEGTQVGMDGVSYSGDMIHHHSSLCAPFRRYICMLMNF